MLPHGPIRLIAIIFLYLTTYASCEETTLQVGPYYIQECQSYDKAIGKALTTMANQIRTAITYINAMKTPGGDTEIYDAFLGGVDPSKVKNLLAQILRGGPFYYHTDENHPPTFICVLKGNPTLTSQIHDCDQSAIPAWHQANSPLIFLCQAFLFQEPVPRNEDCARYIDRRRKKLSYSKIGGAIQTSMLLHELVHIYLGPVSFSNEVYGVNEVIALEKGRKETNAANYVFFVGNVVAECDEFPPLSYAEEGGL